MSNGVYLYLLYLRDLVVLIAWDMIGLVWSVAALWIFYLLCSLDGDNPETIKNVPIRKEWRL